VRSLLLRAKQLFIEVTGVGPAFQSMSLMDPFEQGEIGPDLFGKACEFGLEGLVSKRRDRPIVAGRRSTG
jgi:hypothetical protein